MIIKTEVRTDLDLKYKSEQLKFLKIAQGSSERLLGLLNDILDLSKLEADNMTFDMQSDDLLEVVTAAIEEQAPLRDEKSITLNVQPVSVDTTAYFDSGKMLQVLLNLLSNATKFTPNGTKITIHITESTLSTETGIVPALSVAIQDQGPGVPANELDVIFEKFTQSSETQFGSSGTGLGLSISREIVSAHKGILQAKNQPEGGAEFALKLPIHK